MANESSDHVADGTFREFARGQKLFGRYKLVKILGRGGMGIVWLARDEELEREVALKFLPDLIVLDRALLSELKRETRRSLELTHKNIVRIHDFVNDERSACISMEYIDGDTLSNLRVAKEQKVFDPNKLSGWTAQLCDALDYAHNHARIIHRDLKPANLMVNQKGDLKVSDFGIARSLGDSMSKLTTPSGTSGTLVYMSPQQLDGARGTHLDDVYSLGATLYDLLTSKPPFYSGNVDRQIHERVAPSMTERRKEFNIEPAFVPPLWEETIAACLAKDPARRPQSAAEFARRLQLSSPQGQTVSGVSAKRPKRMALGVGLALLGLIAVVGFYFAKSKPHITPAPSSPAAAIPEKSMAVLPFKPLLPENRDQVLEMGMADTLITKLSNSGEMIVPSLTSVRQYGDLDQDPLAAGRKLGVNSVLEGNVQKSGDRLRVTVRLIKVADGSSLWAGTFDEKFTDVFTVEDTISQKVAEALALRLSGEEQKRLTKRYTENTTAYQLYLMGRYYHLIKLTPPDITKSIGFFQQAIEADPGYALAYFGLAEAYRSASITGDRPPKEVFPLAKAAATKAVEIDESLAEPHAALAFIHMWFDWDWVGAEREARRAIALNPNSAFAHYAYAHLLSNLGRHQEAIAEGARARELDPVSLLFNAREGAVLYYAGRNDEARERLQKAVELDPNFWIAHLF